MHFTQGLSGLVLGANIINIMVSTHRRRRVQRKYYLHEDLTRVVLYGWGISK
jgi:hypothetical protein